MKDNLQYFYDSLINKEPNFDRQYFIDEIIIDDEENELIKNNKNLQDTIYEYAGEREKYSTTNRQMPEKDKENYIYRVINLLSKKNMNLTNFAQSFAVFDSSFSAFSRMNEHAKYNFIEFILDCYVDTRMKLYEKIGDGYLQILYDSHAHKRVGPLGARKISGLLNLTGYTMSNDVGISDNEYFLPDSVQKEKFQEFLQINNIDYPWADSRQNKMPDAVFKHNGIIYIVEHKHLKESGGGQDKQMTELIDLIKKSQDGVSYISYLDGPYFNYLITPPLNTKPYKIKNDIIKYLGQNKNNFLVNTSGFNNLIKDMKK